MSESSTAEVEQALHRLRHLLPPAQVDALQPMGPAAVYTAAVTLHLMIFQRLYPNATLQRAVAHLLDPASPDHRPDRPLSANTGAYSAARTRLTAALCHTVADRLAEHLMAAHPPSWQGRRVFILDGTTVATPHTPDLARAFPPPANQHGVSHWPLCRLVVAHELASGCALRPESGPQTDDEVTLAGRLLDRVPAGSLLLADRNFGIFAFHFTAAARGFEVLTRLTAARFEALRRSATADGDGCWALDWTPTRHDRKGHPEWAADAAVRVWLHAVRVRADLTLYLVSTTRGAGAEWAGLYAQRADGETDIANVKVLLKVDQTRARSAAQWGKEVVVAYLAYNVVVQMRRLAAAQAGVEPRRLSFSGAAGLVTQMLWGARRSAGEWAEVFERLLGGMGQRAIPHRPGRSYPRTVIPRRRKYPRGQPHAKTAQTHPKPTK
jgi:hypothetical protein